MYTRCTWRATYYKISHAFVPSLVSFLFPQAKDWSVAMLMVNTFQNKKEKDVIKYSIYYYYTTTYIYLYVYRYEKKILRSALYIGYVIAMTSFTYDSALLLLRDWRLKRRSAAKNCGRESPRTQATNEASCWTSCNRFYRYKPFDSTIHFTFLRNKI